MSRWQCRPKPLLPHQCHPPVTVQVKVCQQCAAAQHFALGQMQRKSACHVGLLPPAALPFLQARYVALLMKLNAQETIAADQASYALLLSGNAGFTVHATANDSSQRARWMFEAERLAIQLDVPPGELCYTWVWFGMGLTFINVCKPAGRRVGVAANACPCKLCAQSCYTVLPHSCPPILHPW